VLTVRGILPAEYLAYTGVAEEFTIGANRVGSSVAGRSMDEPGGLRAYESLLVRVIGGEAGRLRPGPARRASTTIRKTL
jgi:hypothetical protein